MSVAENLNGIQREQHHRRDACVPIGFGNFGRNVKQPARKKIRLGRLIFARLGRTGRMDGCCAEFCQHDAARRTRGRQRLIGRQLARGRISDRWDKPWWRTLPNYCNSVPASRNRGELPSRRRVGKTILDSGAFRAIFHIRWRHATFFAVPVQSGASAVTFGAFISALPGHLVLPICPLNLTDCRSK